MTPPSPQNDVEPRRLAGMDEPAIHALRFHYKLAVRFPSPPALDHLRLGLGLGEALAEFLVHVASLIHYTHLNDGLVQIDPDTVLTLLHCLPPVWLVSRVHDASEGWRPLYLRTSSFHGPTLSGRTSLAAPPLST